MATTLFLDTFTGGAGSLSSHTPDISPAPHTWADTFGSGQYFNLNGAGAVNPTGTSFSGHTTCRAIPTVPFDCPDGLSFSAGLYLNSSSGSGEDVSCNLIASGSIATIQSYSPSAGVVRIAASVGADAFTEVSVSIGVVHDVEVTASGTSASLFIDSVHQQDIVLSSAVAVTADYVQISASSGFTDANFAISSVMLVATDPAVTPPFWTNFVKTFEVP